MAQPTTIFISYSHADKQFKTELEKRLQILANSIPGLSVWSDSKIQVGDHLNDAIKVHLSAATVFNPLVSPDYLASNVCWK